MSWLWRRETAEGTEFAETENLQPPKKGEGWTLDSKFGVGKVKGAGNSPARSS